MITKTQHKYEFGFGVYYAKFRITKFKTLRITFLWWSIDFMWGVK